MAGLMFSNLMRFIFDFATGLVGVKKGVERGLLGPW
jgi:hypothetical protein